MYLVKKLRENIEIEGIDEKIPLSWWNGMIGAVPVFETEEEAMEYAGGDKNLIQKLFFVSDEDVV